MKPGRKSRLDLVVEQLKVLNEEDPAVFHFVGRRTDQGVRRVQIELLPEVAERLLPLLKRHRKQLTTARAARAA